MILVVDDKLGRAALQQALEPLGFGCEAVGSWSEAARALVRTRFELAVLNLDIDDGNGIELVRRLRDEAPDTRVVVLAAPARIEQAIEAMRLGAFDLVRRPFEMEELRTAARNAVSAGRLERQAAYHAGQARRAFEGILTASVSPAMRKLDAAIAALARHPDPVLVVGEVGSGKSIVARRLHYAGLADGPFVEARDEHALFGRGGSLIETAVAGTLFLVEVGALGTEAQARVLPLLEATGRRGAVEMRVVAASRADLEERTREGHFRRDLYRRLSVHRLLVPPLRERRDDLLLLAEHFIDRDSQRSGKLRPRLSESAASLLLRWHWPGNVGELKTIIERAVLMNDGDSIEPRHLPIELVAP